MPAIVVAATERIAMTTCMPGYGVRSLSFSRDSHDRSASHRSVEARVRSMCPLGTLCASRSAMEVSAFGAVVIMRRLHMMGTSLPPLALSSSAAMTRSRRFVVLSINNASTRGDPDEGMSKVGDPAVSDEARSRTALREGGNLTDTDREGEGGGGAAGVGFATSSKTGMAVDKSTRQRAISGKKKREVKRAASARRAPPEKPLIGTEGVDSMSGQIETTAVLALITIFGVILLEGIFLAISGFLPEEWDDVAVNTIYPAFSPTIGLFLLGSSLFGVYKFLGGGQTKK